MYVRHSMKCDTNSRTEIEFGVQIKHPGAVKVPRSTWQKTCMVCTLQSAKSISSGCMKTAHDIATLMLYLSQPYPIFYWNKKPSSLCWDPKENLNSLYNRWRITASSLNSENFNFQKFSVWSILNSVKVKDWPTAKLIRGFLLKNTKRNKQLAVKVSSWGWFEIEARRFSEDPKIGVTMKTSILIFFLFTGSFEIMPLVRLNISGGCFYLMLFVR